MKVLTFQPPLVKTDLSGLHKDKSNNQQDFESILVKSSQNMAGPNQRPNVFAVVDKISSENRLASQGASVEDVGLAGSLLNSLVSQISNSRPEALANVHNLEGILYYYQL
jgi:hypothetical protein